MDDIKIESYKWYRASEILPEDTDLERNESGIESFFVISVANGDLWCVNRWYEDYRGWYWDADSDYYERLIEEYGITYWMKIDQPK